MQKQILVVGLLLFALACSRKTEPTSSLSIALPPGSVKSTSNKVQKPGASATAVTLDMVHVVINISGGALPSPQVLAWDKSNSGAPSFSTSLPKGTYLIQVLAVYSDSATQSMVFYYGDLNKTLSADTESAEVTVNTLGGAGTSISGQIAGRYLTGAESGPTGELDIKYSPGGGKQDMVIEKSSIMNGWFSVFGLSGVNFVYEVQAGPTQNGNLTLFGRPVSLDSDVFDPRATVNSVAAGEFSRRVKAALPIHVRNNSDGTKSEDPQYLVWGYWGDSSAMASSTWSTRSVCKNDTSGSFSNYLTFNVNSAVWASQPGLVAQSYGTGSTQNLPTAAQLVDQTNPLSLVAFLGGVDGPCPTSGYTAADKYSKYLVVSKAAIDQGGGDSAAGFANGAEINANNSFVTVNLTEPVGFSAVLLPGVDQAMDQIQIYKKVGVTNNYYLNTPDCSALARGYDQYVPAGGGAVTSSQLTLTSNITLAEASAGVAAVFCAQKGKFSYSGGAFLGSWNFQNMGPNMSSGVPATQWNLRFLAGTGTTSTPLVYNSTCVPMVVESKDASGNLAQWPGGVTLTFSGSGTAGDYFASNSTCSTPISSPWSPPWNNNSALLYYKSVRTGASANSVTVSGGALAAASLSFNVQDNSTPPDLIHVVGAPPLLKAFQCYPVSYQTTVSSDPSMAANLTGYAYFYPSITGGKFYSDPMCSMPVNGSLNIGGMIGSIVTTQSTFFRYEQMSTQPVALSGSTASGFSGSYDVVNYGSAQISFPGAPTKIGINVPNMLTENGGCSPFQVNLYDSNNNLTPVTAAMGTVSVSIAQSGSGAVGFSASPMCSVTNSTASMAFLPPNTTNQMMYLKGVTAGDSVITVSFGTAFSANVTVHVTPEVASRMVFILPGMSWTPGTTPPYSSTLPFFAGQTYTVTAYAIKSNNQIDTLYSPGTAATFSFGTSAYLQVSDAQPPFMTNGSSTFHVQVGAGVNYSNYTFTNSPSPLNFGGLAMPMSGEVMSIYDVLQTFAGGVQTWTGPGTSWSTLVCQPALLTAGHWHTITEASSNTFYASLPAGTANQGTSHFTIASLSNTNVNVFTDSTCGTAFAAGDDILTPSDAGKLVYVRPVSSGGTVSSYIYPQAGPFTSSQYYLYKSTATATAAGALQHYEILGPKYVVGTGACNVMAISPSDTNGYAVSVAAAKTVTLGLTGVTGSFYSDSNCTTPLSSNQLTFAVGGPTAQLFSVKINSANSGLVTSSGSLTATDGSITGSSAIFNLNN